MSFGDGSKVLLPAFGASPPGFGGPNPYTSDFGCGLSEYHYKGKIEKALVALRRVLETTKDPKLPADVTHEYGDKYLAAEFVTNTALAATLNALEDLGVSLEALSQMTKWNDMNTATSLRFQAVDRCTYDREEIVTDEGPELVKETAGVFGAKTETTKVVKKTPVYFYKCTSEYELFAYAGNDPDNKVPIRKNSGTKEAKTQIKDKSPYPEVSSPNPTDLNITFLLQCLGKDRKLGFTIDRSHADCKTPRRNPQITKAVDFFRAFSIWCCKVGLYLFCLDEPGVTHQACVAEDVFVPILALFYEKTEEPQSQEATPSTALALASMPRAASADSTVLPPVGEVNLYLQEQKRSLEERCQKLGTIFENPKGLFGVNDAVFASILAHIKDCASAWMQGLDYLETLLKNQLVSAIGKELAPKDFDDYMQFHYRKIFAPKFAPKPFCYAIRRPDHYPEGNLSIESNVGSESSSILTMSRTIENPTSMEVPINAATSITIQGEHHVHAYMATTFGSHSPTHLTLVARARQFSSFILLVGRIASPTLFEPTGGIIIQNKDDLNIPLNIEHLPTAQEFKDATESLSPEQQRFAKAYRSMQLESTLFGLVVVQIKPQLEKLLQLPHDSLTKEIFLTQDLMELFMKYQVPSDLLTAVGGGTAGQAIEEVQGYVGKMKQMVEEAKKKEVEEEEMKKKKAKMEHEAQQETQYGKGRGKGKGFGFGAAPSPGAFGAPAPQQSAAFGAAPRGGGGFGAPPPPQACFGAPPPPPAPGGGFGAPRAAAFGGGGFGVPAPAAAVGGSGALFGAPPPPPPPPPPAQPIAPEPTAKKPGSSGGAMVAGGLDYTKVPSKIDSSLEELDEDAAVRSCIIKPGRVWNKKAQKGLLSSPTSSSVNVTEQKAEKNRAFDLLDALSRSGTLTIGHTTLHVLVATTHCFDQTLMQTVVEGNVNPIEKVERSALIVASTIYGEPATALVTDNEKPRVQTYSPKLFEDRMLE